MEDSERPCFIAGVYRQHLTARAHKHTFLTAHFARDHTCGSRHFACLTSHFVIGHVFAEHSFNPVSLTPPTTSPTPLTGIRCKPLCSFARGWTAWPSGRSDPTHRATRVSHANSCELLLAVRGPARWQVNMGQFFETGGSGTQDGCWWMKVSWRLYAILVFVLFRSPGSVEHVLISDLCHTDSALGAVFKLVSWTSLL